MIDLWYLVEKVVVSPIDPKDLVEHNKKAMVSKQILLNSMKDHLTPHIVGKKTAKEMYDALGTLYQSVNISTKIHLKNKLSATCMSKTNTMKSYFTKIAKLRGQIATIGNTVEENELIHISLILLLYRIRSLLDTVKGGEQYPYFAYYSSESIASASSLICSRHYCVGVSDLLASVGITMDWLPLFRYSLDALGHLLPTR
jgi:hypothetical protein